MRVPQTAIANGICDRLADIGHTSIKIHVPLASNMSHPGVYIGARTNSIS